MAEQNYPDEVRFAERPYICMWKIIVNHIEDFDKLKEIERCFECDGHDLLCRKYLSPDDLGNTTQKPFSSKS